MINSHQSSSRLDSWAMLSNATNSSNHNNIERCNYRFCNSTDCTMNCFQHTCWSGKGTKVCKSHATHWALIMCDTSHSMWCKWTAQLSSLTEFKILFICSLIHCPQLKKEGLEMEHLEKTPSIKCHILKSENSSPKRDTNLHSSMKPMSVFNC